MTDERKRRGVPLWGAILLLPLGLIAVSIIWAAIQDGDTPRVVLGCLMGLGALVYITGYLTTLKRRP